MELQVNLSLDLQLEKYYLLIRFSIYFWIDFILSFFMSSDNYLTPEKFLGSRMKWETSEPDSPKSKSCKISFTTFLNVLFLSLNYFLKLK